MRFSEIIGNEALKESLVKMVQGNRLGHAILFTEENGGGAFAFALALAQYVNCRDRQGADSCGVCSSCHKYQKLIHPDLHFVFPVSSSNALSESEKKGLNQKEQMQGEGFTWNGQDRQSIFCAKRYQTFIHILYY